MIRVRVYGANGHIALHPDGTGNRLCPACKEKYQPLTPAMRRNLDELNGKLWRNLKKRGCPCCQAGLQWYPAKQRHCTSL
jgi:hypothetical protein